MVRGRSDKWKRSVSGTEQRFPQFRLPEAVKDT